MKKEIGITLALALSVLSAAGSEQADKTEAETHAGKPKKEPFYRRYLIPGNPLDEKIKEQEKLIEANPKSPALRNDFGNLLALRRFPKLAREQYEIAMKLDENYYLAAYNLGIVSETEGRVRQAIRAYEKAVNRNPGFPPGLFRLGLLYEKVGETRRAIEVYARAMRIDPQMRDPRHNPLVADSQLLDLVSLVNYERDLASASIAFDARFAEEMRLRRLPYDRPIDSTEGQPAAASPAAASPAAVSPAPPSTRRAPEPKPAPPVRTRPQAVVPGSWPTAVPAPPAGPTPAPTSLPSDSHNGFAAEARRGIGVD
jgi:tetratricopeptide (TPR) repeat protein